jgi:hypothetical protein
VEATVPCCTRRLSTLIGQIHTLSVRVSALLIVVLPLWPLTGCTRATSSVVEPTEEKCHDQIAVRPNGSAFGPAGGHGVLEVDASRDCTWAARTDASWITLAAPARGQGAAKIAYEVEVNVTPVARRGGVMLSSLRIEIAQEAAPCRYTVYRGTLEMPSGGGVLSVFVAAMPGCPWTARSEAPWIAVASGATGNGPGEVVFSAPPNQGAARKGVVVIEDQVLTVLQGAA